MLSDLKKTFPVRVLALLMACSLLVTCIYYSNNKKSKALLTEFTIGELLFSACLSALMTYGTYEAFNEVSSNIKEAENKYLADDDNLNGILESQDKFGAYNNNKNIRNYEDKTYNGLAYTEEVIDAIDYIMNCSSVRSAITRMAVDKGTVNFKEFVDESFLHSSDNPHSNENGVNMFTGAGYIGRINIVDNFYLITHQYAYDKLFTEYPLLKDYSLVGMVISKDSGEVYNPNGGYEFIFLRSDVFKNKSYSLGFSAQNGGNRYRFCSVPMNSYKYFLDKTLYLQPNASSDYFKTYTIRRESRDGYEWSAHEGCSMSVGSNIACSAGSGYLFYMHKDLNFGIFAYENNIRKYLFYDARTYQGGYYTDEADASTYEKTTAKKVATLTIPLADKDYTEAVSKHLDRVKPKSAEKDKENVAVSDLPATASVKYKYITKEKADEYNAKMKAITKEEAEDIVITYPTYAVDMVAANDLAKPYEDVIAVNPALAVPTTMDEDIDSDDEPVVTVPDTGYSNHDLSEIFPFCIPFDMYRIMKAFHAPRKVPELNIPFYSVKRDYSAVGGFSICEVGRIKADLSIFEKIAFAWRAFELLLFEWMLCTKAYAIIGGGQT